MTKQTSPTLKCYEIHKHWRQTVNNRYLLDPSRFSFLFRIEIVCLKGLNHNVQLKLAFLKIVFILTFKVNIALC